MMEYYLHPKALKAFKDSMEFADFLVLRMNLNFAREVYLCVWAIERKTPQNSFQMN